ncbi:hypothetical protein SLEP1_g56502 [Rubroshorea leprosula]|uniref:Uncharacterized protein n=1 Tax=Rubroshorea leprosula TaxID=152421 RepID=A0AAV5MJR5_9ROSI|nr:hypothetical protein SLEP1_g56502 [Rubroshorea leprosula]
MEKVLTNKGLRRFPIASISLLSFTIAKSRGASLERHEPRAALKIKSSGTSHFIWL